MTRESKILQTAAEWLRYYHPTCTQDMLCRAFECGAKWADEHPHWFDPKEELPQKVHEGDMWSQVIISKDGFTREASYSFRLGKFEIFYTYASEYIEPDYWMYMPKAHKKD